MQRFNAYSIFEGVEDIIRSFKLTQGSDAFLQFFLDFVFDYTQRKSQKNISFLEFWEEKNDKLNIVNSDGIPAVQIMTIHKSKGLEFPVVIFPYDLDIYFERSPKAWYSKLDQEDFNGFESILVDSTSRIQKAGVRGEMILESQRKEKQLDSFNLLYVCLTRAVEQLYIISENKEPKERLGWSSLLFKDFLVNRGSWEEGKTIYEFGERKPFNEKQLTTSNAETQTDFISSSWKDHQINIVANSAMLWDSKRGSAIGYCNLIHEMMSHIYSESDVDKTIEGFINKGLLPRAQMADGIKTINSIVLHPELKAYFDPEKKVFTEREILSDSGQILIPDRLVFQGNGVVVIDYKTGLANSEHQRQIDTYARVLEKLKYEVMEKVLVYIDKEITIIKS
mgnify:FL=1